MAPCHPYGFWLGLCAPRSKVHGTRALGKSVQPCSLWATQAPKSNEPLCGGEGGQRVPWVEGVCKLQARQRHARGEYVLLSGSLAAGQTLIILGC